MVLGAGFLLLSNYSSSKDQAGSEAETYTLQEEGLVFEYQTGANGYVLEEQEADASVSAQFVRGLTLTPSKDYEDQKNREGGEGSPSLSLLVYRNALNQSASVWVERNPAASNIQLALDTPAEGVVAGANAVSYTIDGLYPTKVTAIASGGFIFLASAAYFDQDSQTLKDFRPWLDSFTFVPTESAEAPQAKIDVRVACESALAYMSFIDGAAADAFVAACIEGEHPEVIERYISDMGADGRAI